MRIEPSRSWQHLMNSRFDWHVQQFHPTRARSGDARPEGSSVSRRTFMRGIAGTAGLALSTGLWLPMLSGWGSDHADAPTPKPIPNGRRVEGIFIHHFVPRSPSTPLSQIPELSNITDFNGVVGATQIRGAGTGTGFASPLAFAADMGFMQGEYIGEDGRHANGTFGFI